jgi:Domain of unknown function (DUF222)
MTSTLLDDLDTASAALGRVSVDVAEFRSLDEASLLELNRRWADANRILGATGALIAGEVARRSAPELGSEGLARRSGLRTPEQFIKVTTGLPAQQAGTAVKVGTMVLEAANEGLLDVATGEVATSSKPWLSALGEAVRAGRVSPAAADSISSGLGTPNSAVSAEDLRGAVAILCAEATGADVPNGNGPNGDGPNGDGRPRADADKLFKRARQLRDELDLDGVKVREAEQVELRGMKYSRFPTGMSRLIWDMDPETDALVKPLFDRATSPKLGGVRFVDSTQAALAKSILDDTRSPSQLASDAFLQLLLQGADAPTDFLLGSGAPVIKIAATRTTAETRRGLVHIEGHTDAVSVETLERHLCNGTEETTNFDENGIPLDMGHDQRLFTRRQKGVLALKWGGCACPDCPRPPSWTEAHHIKWVKRDKGKTDIADGILLCKYHHLLFHNYGWEIERDERGDYWLFPPTGSGPEQNPILLEPKGGVMRDLQRERERRERAQEAG